MFNQFSYLYIKYIRLLNNYSQSELSKKIFISKGYLSRIESGKQDPSLEVLLSFCAEFDLDIQELEQEDSSEGWALIERLSNLVLEVEIPILKQVLDKLDQLPLSVEQKLIKEIGKNIYGIRIRERDNLQIDCLAKVFSGKEEVLSEKLRKMWYLLSFLKSSAYDEDAATEWLKKYEAEFSDPNDQKQTFLITYHYTYTYFNNTKFEEALVYVKKIEEYPKVDILFYDVYKDMAKVMEAVYLYETRFYKKAKRLFKEVINSSGKINQVRAKHSYLLSKIHCDVLIPQAEDPDFDNREALVNLRDIALRLLADDAFNKQCAQLALGLASVLSGAGLLEESKKILDLVGNQVIKENLWMYYYSLSCYYYSSENWAKFEKTAYKYFKLPHNKFLLEQDNTLYQLLSDVAKKQRKYKEAAEWLEKIKSNTI